MKKTIIFFCIWFIFLLLISSLQVEAFPSESNIKKYVDNLLESYNSLIYVNEWKRLDFNERQKFFYLFHEPDISYNVTCVSSEIDGVITLIFKQVPSYQENIYLDFQHKINDYYQGFALFGENGYYTDNFAGSGGSMRYMFYAFSMRQDDISNNTNITINNSGQRASWLYSKDKNSIEQYKINLIWTPFKENYSEVINNDDYNLVWREFDFQNKISSDGYTYESFLIDFYQFNKTVHHYFDKPKMLEELNAFINYSSNLNYSIIFFNLNYDFKNLFANDMNTIRNNINNESYLYTDFQADFLALNQSIQNKADAIEKYYNNWIISILVFSFTLVLMVILLIALSLEEEKTQKNTYWKYLILLIGLIIPIIWTSIPKDGADYLQIIFPYTALFFAVIIFRYRNKIVIRINNYKRKKRIKKAINQLKNKEIPYALMVGDADYFRNNYDTKEIKKIKDRKILKKYLTNETKKLAIMAKKVLEEQQEKDIAFAKEVDRLFNQNNQEQNK